MPTPGELQKIHETGRFAAGCAAVSSDRNLLCHAGGTAINLFVRDMPRLSVDIDLTYVPIEERGTSLKHIGEALVHHMIKYDWLTLSMNERNKYGVPINRRFTSTGSIQPSVIFA